MKLSTKYTRRFARQIIEGLFKDLQHKSKDELLAIYRENDPKADEQQNHVASFIHMTIAGTAAAILATKFGINPAEETLTAPTP